MNILTLDNTVFSLNNLPESVDENARFSVLDNSNPHDPDFFFVPLIFLESFNSPAVVLRIGEQEVTMPLDWCIAVGDGESSTNIEVIPLSSLNDRGFDALVFNPLTSHRIEFKPIEIINFYSDIRWYFPKMKNGQLLTTPLSNNDKPECAFFVKEISRYCEVIHLDRLL
jgi:hypothetical protein